MRSVRKSVFVIFAALVTGTVACASEPLASFISPTQLIEPTDADPGYFVDPYPVYVADGHGARPDPQWITGTTRQLLTCKTIAAPGCYQKSPLDVDTRLLRAEATKAGMKLGVYDNANVFRDDHGHWQMAFTVYVKDPSRTGPDAHWTVIGHAHPVPEGPGVPAQWLADSVLVGSLVAPARGNYDGKYFKDGGQLYLVYSKRLDADDMPGIPLGEAHDGIVAQALAAPDKVKSDKPRVLLAPASEGKGFNSELFHPDEPKDKFKLVETGNITRISNVYVMAYSTGAYNRPAYKTGVAYSDTFLPAAGKTYRKVFMTDNHGVWGAPGHLEVRYLLQGAKRRWPNYIGDKVLAPGVPTVVEKSQGQWSLYFAGYSVTDAPKVDGTQNFDGSHRRPYTLPLEINIPARARVESATDDALMTWIRLRATPGS